MQATRLALIASSLLSVAQATAQTACGRAGSAVDAVPAFVGFTDVCAVDAALCRAFSAGYPPSVRMLGYFVPDTIWAAFRSGRVSSFDEYLIAQAAGRRSAAEFAELKESLRQRNGTIPDNSRLPLTVARDTRVPLGVVGETHSAIIFGVVMHLQLAGEESGRTTPMVSLNIAMQRDQSTLSLYVFRRYRSESDVERAKRDAAAWVACIEKSR